jgi:dolichyl-diphosphooligosaccharide--protein glycosyltransferase/undecaprenyl-diphosphooligosaccharide--protein glycosyltransferase
MTLNIGKNKVNLKRFVDVRYDEKMKNIVSVKSISLNAPLTLIYMRSYKTFLVIDEKTYNSMYIQLMLLENYNHKLYEKVVSNPYAKIYKLKI